MACPGIVSLSRRLRAGSQGNLPYLLLIGTDWPNILLFATGMTATTFGCQPAPKGGNS